MVDVAVGQIWQRRRGYPRLRNWINTQVNLM